MKIQHNNINTPLDTLLDMETDLWELEFELQMPDWYWINSKYKNEHKHKIRVVKNKMLKVLKEIDKQGDNYE